MRTWLVLSLLAALSVAAYAGSPMIGGQTLPGDPIATYTRAGKVMVDPSTMNVDGTGKISVIAGLQQLGLNNTFTGVNTFDQAILAPNAPIVYTVGFPGYTNIPTVLAAMVASGVPSVLDLQGQTYYLTAPITVRCDLVTIKNGTLNFQALTSGNAITVTGRGTGTPYKQDRTVFENVEVGGSGLSSSVTGFYLNTAAEAGTSHLLFINVNTHDFNVGHSYGSNAYLVNWINSDIYNTTTAVQYGAGNTNSGERIAYDNCVIYDSTNGVDVQASEFSFTNCSLDYFTNFAFYAHNGAIITLAGHNHVETNATGDYELKTAGAVSKINNLGTLDFTITGSRTLELGNGGNSDGGIYVGNAYATVVSGTYSPVSWFTGFTKQTSPANYDLTTARNRLWNINDNFLSDGGFENSGSPGAEWVVSTGSNYNAPVLDTSTYHSGAQSLKFTTSASGKQSSMTKYFSIQPGAKPIVLYYLKNSFGSGDTFTVTTGYTGLINYGSITAPTYIQTFSSAGTNYSTFTPVYAHPTTPAPAGAIGFYVTFTENNTTGTSSSWIDDVNIEMLDSTVSDANWQNLIYAVPGSGFVGIGRVPQTPLDVNGTVRTNSNLQSEQSGTAGSPFLMFMDGLGTNLKRWDWYQGSSGQLILRALNDTSSASNNALNFSRSGYTITGMQGPLTTFSTLGSVPAAGYQIYCTDCTTAATCAGSGTGHMAVSNGTNWTCQ